jgi:hypothetical protein
MQALRQSALYHESYNAVGPQLSGVEASGSGFTDGLLLVRDPISGFPEGMSPSLSHYLNHNGSTISNAGAPHEARRKTRPSTVSPASKRHNSRTRGGGGNSIGINAIHSRKTKQLRPQTAAGTRRSAASEENSISVGRTGGGRPQSAAAGSLLHGSTNVSSAQRLRSISAHLRNIVSTEKYAPQVPQVSPMKERPSSDAAHVIARGPQSQFAPSLKLNSDKFISWLSSDWLEESVRMRAEAKARFESRAVLTTKANAESRALADRQAGIYEDEDGGENVGSGDDDCNRTEDEQEEEREDDEDGFEIGSDEDDEESMSMRRMQREAKLNGLVSPAVNAFNSWVSDAWPGVSERRIQTGTRDSHTYPSEELLLLSRRCQEHGAAIGESLSTGFQTDLRWEVERKGTKSPYSTSATSIVGVLPNFPALPHRVRLLDRWFDLSLQQLLHQHQAEFSVRNTRRKIRSATKDRKMRARAGEQESIRNKTDLSGDDSGDPIAESSRSLWQSGMVPLHIVAASEAVQLVAEMAQKKKKNIGTGGGGMAASLAPPEQPLIADLMHRVVLGLVQSTTDVLAQEVAKRQRAEKLARDTAKELSRMKSAKTGWKKARSAVRGYFWFSEEFPTCTDFIRD